MNTVEVTEVTYEEQQHTSPINAKLQIGPKEIRLLLKSFEQIVCFNHNTIYDVSFTNNSSKNIDVCANMYLNAAICEVSLNSGLNLQEIAQTILLLKNVMGDHRTSFFDKLFKSCGSPNHYDPIIFD